MIILLVTSNVATLSFTQHQRLRALIFLMSPQQKNIIFLMEHMFVDLPFPYWHIYWWHHVGENPKTVGQWKWSAFGQPLDVLWLLCWQLYVCLLITLTRSPKAELRRVQLNEIGRKHMKGASGCRQTVMNDPGAQQLSQMFMTWLKPRQQHRELRALHLTNSVWVL